MKSVELSKEIVANMTLRLPGTVGKIASKMRYVDRRAPELVRGGIIRTIPDATFEQVRGVGISCVSKSLEAFGGILYGAAALRHDVSVRGNQVVETFQDSRIDINDINYLETKQRLTWKEYLLVYELLEELFAEHDRPDIILLDIPLTLQRAQQINRLEAEDVAAEWEATLAAITRFWERNLCKVFPEDPDGPIIVALTRRYFGAILNAVHGKQGDASPEDVSEEALSLVTQNWTRLHEVGIMRVLKGMLKAQRRTAAYYYEALGGALQRSEPEILADYGRIGLHIKVGYRTPVWQVETLGGTGHPGWDTPSIDRLCSLLTYLTLYDNPKALPLPLWYAKQLARMPRSVLVNYYRETIRLLQDESVDASWLAGLDELEDEASE